MKNLFTIAALSIGMFSISNANAAFGDSSDFTTKTLAKMDRLLFAAAEINIEQVQKTCEFIQDHEDSVDAVFDKINSNTVVCKLHVVNYWGEEGNSIFYISFNKNKVLINHSTFDISAFYCSTFWEEELKSVKDAEGKNLPNYVISRNSIKSKDGKMSVYVNYEDKNDTCVMKYEFAR